MKLLKKVALTAAIALGSIAANATTFDFSYTFDPTNVANDVTNAGETLLVTGSFSATANGAVMSNISNVQLAFNGIAFNGPLLMEGLDSTGNFSSTAVASLSGDVTQTNFVIADADVSTGAGLNNVSNYFEISNSPAAITTGGQVFGINYNVTDANGNFVAGSDLTATQSKWTFSAVTAAVPEPESIAMLLAGLGLVGAAVRRRKQQA